LPACNGTWKAFSTNNSLSVWQPATGSLSSCDNCSSVSLRARSGSVFKFSLIVSIAGTSCPSQLAGLDP